jgi:hypothetical protein
MSSFGTTRTEPVQNCQVGDIGIVESDLEAHLSF